MSSLWGFRTSIPVMLVFFSFGCMDKSFTILSINDVYRIEGLLPSEVGGLSRVRTLRKTIEANGSEVLVLHGGDLVSPSLLSRQFKGRQMIDVLNGLDGAIDKFDERMFVVFGNHEFDNGDADDSKLFSELVATSQFYWLGSNIELNEVITSNGSRFRVDDSPIVRSKIVRLDGIDVGLFSITLDVEDIDFASFHHTKMPALAERASELTRELRAAGADIVIALTHQKETDDVSILKLPDGPDLVIGGHEHEALILPVLVTTSDGYQQTRYLLRGSSDAREAIEAKIILGPANRFPVVVAKLHELAPGKTEQDADLQELIDVWVERHATIFCKDRDEEPGCLEEPLATFTEKLYGDELSIRSKATNIGVWVAAQMKQAAERVGNGKLPMIGLINSGALRLNQNLEKGKEFTRRHFEELVQYNDDLYTRTIPRKMILEVLNHSVASCGNGAWLQISGLKYTADFANKQAINVQLANGNPIPDKVQVVTTHFIANKSASGDQDGYVMWNNIPSAKLMYSKKVVELKPLLKDNLEAASPINLPTADEKSAC